MLALLAAFLLLGPAKPESAAPHPPESVPPATADEYVAQCTPDWIDREALAKALKDAGTNWTEIARALDAFRPPGDESTDADYAYGSMLWLVESAPHLDRLELTALVLIDNLRLALAAAQAHGYDPGSDPFRRYVLNYRLDDEPVTNWRGEVRRRYEASVSGAKAVTDPSSISAIAIAAAAGFRTIERGYFGNLADPISLDNARAGSERELTLLTAAVLRALGWAVRYTREGRTGKSWVEVYTGPGGSYDANAWIPVYPAAPEQSGYFSYAKDLCGGEIGLVTAGDAFAVEQVTPRYADVCALVPHITLGGEEQKDYKHWSIEAWYDGRYTPLDDISTADDPANPVVGLPEGTAAAAGTYFVGAPGTYMLTAGVRYPGGYVHLVTQQVQAQPGGRIEVELRIDPPPGLPVEAMAERSAGEGAPQTGTHLYVVIDEKEPSSHTLGLLEPLKATAGLDCQVLAANTSDTETQKMLTDVLKVAAGDPKPVVVLIRDGKTLLYQRGYNLSILDWVKRALGS
jgi:hypothetical protein